jgi:hypothetical protein
MAIFSSRLGRFIYSLIFPHNSVLVQRSEASKRVSSSKDEEGGFLLVVNERVAADLRMGWIFGWERSQEMNGK